MSNPRALAIHWVTSKCQFEIPPEMLGAQRKQLNMNILQTVSLTNRESEQHSRLRRAFKLMLARWISQPKNCFQNISQLESELKASIWKSTWVSWPSDTFCFSHLISSCCSATPDRCVSTRFNTKEANTITCLLSRVPCCTIFGIPSWSTSLVHPWALERGDYKIRICWTYYIESRYYTDNWK